MRKGFTLVELLVGLSLFALLVAGVVCSFGQGLRGWKKAAHRAATLQVRNIVAENIANDIRSAAAILTISSSEELVLQIDGETVSYRLNNLKVRRKSGSTSAYLTNENEIIKLIFGYPESGLVEVSLDDVVFLVGKRDG